MGLSLQLASGARTPLFPPGRGPVPPGATKVATPGRPCHVPMAEGPLQDTSPTTALNAGWWTVRTQVKAWSAQLTPR
jgi:hypothetical protein